MKRVHSYVTIISLAAMAAVGCRPGARAAHQPPAQQPAAAPQPPPPPPAPPYTGPTVEVPAGSRLVMTIDQEIDSRRMGAGQRFRVSLDAALLDAAGNVVVPASTKVLGLIAEAQEAGNVAGRTELVLAFTDLEIGGRLFPIQSQGVQAVGESSGKDTARKVAAGALIGAAVNGSKGAARGAAVGGAVALVTRGSEIRIPAGTLLELTLVAPAKVPAPAGMAAAAAPVAPAAAAPAAAAPAAAAPAAAAPAAAAPAAAAPAAAAPAAAAPAASSQANKDCVKKLMANGFSADEALKSCEGK